MIAKAAITTVIAALLAGGVVYYGMPSEGAPSDAQTVQEHSDPIKKSWIDRHLKVGVNSSTPTDSDALVEPVRNDLDQTETSGAEVDLPERGDLNDVRQTEPDGTNVIENGASQDGYVPSGEPVAPPPGEKQSAMDANFRLEIAKNQIEKISQPELKDQAILELVEYALANRLFGVAEDAVDGISQPELRDTARSRIANAYAMAGRADEAFAMIEAVEIDALRDVMRLQAIQALISPQNLPRAMQ